MVRNQERAIQLKELMETLLEAIPELMRLLKEPSLTDFYQLAGEVQCALLKIKTVAEDEPEDIFLKAKNIAINCLTSLERLMQYAFYNREIALQKLEFEFWPFLRMMHIEFSFFALIYPDSQKMEEWYMGEGMKLCRNYYVEEAERTGHYKYDVSIIVTGYNKLEYTQMCVKTILENLPKNIKCELILRNHGSTDGTKEYFEGVHPTKQLDYAINRAGSGAALLVSEGKYIFAISNDVLITPNMIEIFYEAFEENDDYAYAVPITPNVSNLQGLIGLHHDGNVNGGLQYRGAEELREAARNFNRRDARKEEVRFRLCDPLAFLRNKCFNLEDRPSFLEIQFTQPGDSMFPDDLESMYMRRAGYKNVLMKDLYAHHFGSVTIKDENIQTANYEEGRRVFLDRNGIDPWGPGFCWSYELFDKLLCDKKGCKQILGINSGLGSNILKVQQEIREHTGEVVQITVLTDNPRHIPDLVSMTERTYIHEGWHDIRNSITEQYDYILVDAGIEEAYQENVRFLYEHLLEEGKLIVFVPENREDIISWIESNYDEVSKSQKSGIWYEIDEVIPKDAPRMGYFLFWSKN